MQRIRANIRPIAADDPEARGDVALAVEIRRTVAWIRYCEAQIERRGGELPPDTGVDSIDSAVASDTALAAYFEELRLTSREITTGQERGELTDLLHERYAAGIDTWEEKLRWNRSHLANLTRQWIAAGFEAKRLEMLGRTIDRLQAAIDSMLRDLGHNPHDADVRAIVARRIADAARD